MVIFHTYTVISYVRLPFWDNFTFFAWKTHVEKFSYTSRTNRVSRGHGLGTWTYKVQYLATDDTFNSGCLECHWMEHLRAITRHLFWSSTCKFRAFLTPSLKQKIPPRVLPGAAEIPFRDATELYQQTRHGGHCLRASRNPPKKDPKGRNVTLINIALKWWCKSCFYLFGGLYIHSHLQFLDISLSSFFIHPPGEPMKNLRFCIESGVPRPGWSHARWLGHSSII